MIILLSILSPLIPVLTGFKRKSHLLWWYSIASIFTDIINTILHHCCHTKSSVSNFFALTEFCIFLFFFKNKVFRSNTLFYFILVSGIIYFILDTFQTQNWLKLNRRGISVLVLVYIANCFAGFYFMLKEQKIVFLEKSGFFWANVALFSYSSGAFFLFLIYDSLKNNNDQKMLWVNLFLSLNILKNILLGIALSKKEES